MKLPIAIQLFSVRDAASEDIEGTLKALKEMGYSGVEFAGLYGKKPEEIRAMCEKIGLVPLSAHVPYVQLRDNMDEKIDECVALGCKYVAISTMHREFHKGGEEHEGVYDNLKKISARLREHGIQFLYHNHSYEMIEYEGKRLYEWLFESMDEGELQPEIDTAWMELEVGEAESYLRKFKNRCDLVHIKNFYGKEGYDELVHSPELQKPRGAFDFCNFERGRLDVLPIARTAIESGAKWLVVEQDNRDPDLTELESAKINIDVLKKL